MEELWLVVQCYGNKAVLKTGLNRPLSHEILENLDKSEGKGIELLIDSVSQFSFKDSAEDLEDL